MTFMREYSPAENVDAGDNGKGSAGVDAHDARVGQRVAGHALHGGAGEAEGTAGQQSKDGARNAVVDHRMVAIGGIELGERLPHSAEGKASRADRQ